MTSSHFATARRGCALLAGLVPVTLALLLVMVAPAGAQTSRADKFEAWTNKLTEKLELLDSGLTALGGLSDSERARLGQTLVGNALRQYPLWANETYRVAVNHIARDLVVASDLKLHPFVGIIRAPGPHGMSFIDDSILVSLALMQSADTVDEAAAVIAHELAHLQLGHPNAAIARIYQHELADKVIEKKLEKRHSPELVGKLIQTASGALLFSRTRSDETDADALAWSMLGKAGYDPYALVSMLQKLESIEPPEDRLDSTHPSATVRLEALRVLAGAAPASR